MIASEARLAANRANALKSSGPRTAEGKERSRANSYKHGMTGAGVVVPRDQAEVIEARLASFQGQFGPATDAGQCLVRRAAMLSVRLERCMEYDSAATSKNVRDAGVDFDEARMADVDHLMASIADEPASCVRWLRRMPEGVDRMISAWLDLRSDLDHGDAVGWSSGHEERAENLTGRGPDGFGTSRVRVLSRAIRGDFALLTPGEGPSDDPEARRRWARARMAEQVDAEVARLRDHRAALDLEAIAAERAEAASLALFDPSKEATLARKYEAAAERGMYRALREMRQVEAEAQADVQAEPQARPEAGPPTPGRLGSFLPGAAASPGPLVPDPPQPRSGETSPRFEASDGSSLVPITVGRRP